MMWKIYVFFALHERLTERHGNEQEHHDQEDTAGDDTESLRSGDDNKIR